MKIREGRKDGGKEGRKEGALIRARTCDMDITTALDVPV